MLNKGAFALEIVRGDPELTADCRVTLNRGDRIGSLDCMMFEPRHGKKTDIGLCVKTMAQISCAVTEGVHSLCT